MPAVEEVIQDQINRDRDCTSFAQAHGYASQISFLGR